MTDWLEDMVPLREWTLHEITVTQHEKSRVLMAKALLRKIREAVVATEGATDILVSVSSIDPQFASLSFDDAAAARVCQLIQEGVPEFYVTTRYEHCWFGAVSGGLCGFRRKPRHRIVAHVRITGARA